MSRYPELLAREGTDVAYPILITQVLPPGAVGLVVAAMLSALMSTLASVSFVVLVGCIIGSFLISFFITHVYPCFCELSRVGWMYYTSEVRGF